MEEIRICKTKFFSSLFHLWLNLIGYLSHLWLIGSLFKAGRKTYAGALYEFTYLLLWSILPFGLGALTLYVASDDQGKSFIDFWLSTFRNGELLVFTISMLAPILYLTLHEPDQAGQFPHKLPISTVVALIVVTCAALFALLKAHAVKDIDFVFKLSVILTLLALAFRYLALVYHRLRMPQITENELRSAQDDFVNDYRKHVEDTEPHHNVEDFMRGFENHLGGQQ